MGSRTLAEDTDIVATICLNRYLMQSTIEKIATSIGRYDLYVGKNHRKSPRNLYKIIYTKGCTFLFSVTEQVLGKKAAAEDALR